jgi:hypothetical protein
VLGNTDNVLDDEIAAKVRDKRPLSGPQAVAN